jgi:hypothetical protein
MENSIDHKKCFCETLGHWLYHPLDTSHVCDNRALKFPECRRCRGIEPLKIKTVQKESSPTLVTLNVDREEWARAVRELKEDYDIRQGTKQDETSARRIAILLGELYLTHFHDSLALFRVPIIEKDGFDLAIEYRLKCDPLERESRVKSKLKKQVLCTWGVDKTSGVEGYTSQLKEWTRKALLENPEELEEESYGADGREIDFRGRPLESTGFEEIGIGPS